MLTLIRQTNFFLFWLAGLISTLGSHLLGIAIPYYVYEQTGSALATGATVAANFLPPILIGSLAGTFVDRWQKKNVMIAADLLRFLILLPMLLVHSPAWLWLIYLILFLHATISQFFNPAQSAIVPQLVNKEELVAANSLISIASKFSRFVGPPLGGALLGAIGLTSVVFFDSISFLLSGILLMFIYVSTKQIDDAKNHGPTTPSIQLAAQKSLTIWQEWITGLSIIRHNSLIKSLLTVEGIGMIAEGIINVLWVAFVQDVIQASSLEFGWLSSVFALGALVGGFVVGQANSSSPSINWISFGRMSVGILWLLMLNFPNLSFAYVLLFLNGIVAIGYGVNTQTLLQLSVTDQYRGRIFGSYNTTNAFMRLLGVGLAVTLGDYLGPSVVLQLGVSLFIIAGLYAASSLHRHEPENLIAEVLQGKEGS